MALYIRDDALEFEVGRKAALSVWDENRGTSLVPLEDKLGARIIRGKREAKQYALRTQRVIKHFPIYENTHASGARPCLDPYCEPCEEGTQRLLRDVWS